MNRNRLMNLIDHIDSAVDDDHFDMANFMSRIIPPDGPGRSGYFSLIRYSEPSDIIHCKTAGCIAGWTFMMMTEEERRVYEGRVIPECGDSLIGVTAKNYLELNDEQANVLFVPNTSRAFLRKITREHALAVLRNILTTSIIDWRAVLPPDLAKSLHKSAAFPVTVALT